MDGLKLEVVKDWFFQSLKDPFFSSKDLHSQGNTANRVTEICDKTHNFKGHVEKVKSASIPGGHA